MTRALDQTVKSIRERTDSMLYTKLGMGEQPTFQFAEFCEAGGMSLADGIFDPHRPWPFALRNPMVCRKCGNVERADKLHRDEHFVLIASGGYGAAAEPGQWELSCPNCEATNSYIEQVTCDACGEFPCVCQWSDLDVPEWGAAR